MRLAYPCSPAQRLIGAAAVVVLSIGLLPAPGLAAPGTPSPPIDAGGQRSGARPDGAAEVPVHFDARRDGPARSVLASRRASLAARPSQGTRALRESLGRQGIVDIDPLTATPRQVTRLDRFLTGPSKRPASAVALDYLRAHPGAFGLTDDEVSALRLRKQYVDIAGTRHLSFVQQVAGVPVFGNGLRAHVAKNGELIQVDGAPLSQLPAAPGTARLSATGARDAAVADVQGRSRAGIARQRPGPARETVFTTGDRAALVLFHTLGGTRLAWQTITLTEGYLHVLDAQTGRVLYRRSLTAQDSGLAWSNYAGAANGGSQQRRDFTKAGWLPAGSPRLAGNVAHVYTDVNDNDVAEASEEVTPSAPRRFDYPFTDFTAETGAPCTTGFQCSWNPNVPESWQANREQNATQMFFYLGTFHDHLLERPIGFTRAAGNFEAVDGDAVQGQALDGAAVAAGMPDAAHVDNANMTTPPDGVAPKMQMYLFHEPGASAGLLATNSGDTADILYHEYTHGLSNRLVVDAGGMSTLGALQAGAMGEGWSDWYALDYLVGAGLEQDTPKPGEVRMGKAVTAGGTIRTMPIDCPVGDTTIPECAGGGYTYGDFGRVYGRPQVHADGEIWSQTLWDLRTELGSRLSRSLVTRAMELAPANPSYLDMRNSILQADLVVNGGRAQRRVWKVFAARGMGWFAASVDGDDIQPVESFTLPPAANTPSGTLTGRVVDTVTRLPLAGAIVGFGGHASGFGTDYAAVTAADGTYTLRGVLVGTYPKMFARAPGYDLVSRTVSVAKGTQTQDWSLRRDWAATSGGGAVVTADGVDATEFGCGPSALFDQSQGAGWSTDAKYDDAGGMRPRSVTLRLPAPVDITELAINPSATCGDAASAGTSRYRVETSSDGAGWVEANVGDFGLSHRDRMNKIPLAAGTESGVRFVRYTMLSSQVEDMAGSCPGEYDGCEFVDSVELAIYGVTSEAPAGTAPVG